jgi:GAF domain-containing protein
MSSGDTTIEREQIRLDALRRYDVLGAFGEAQFDDVAELAAHLCQTPMAGITAMDASRKWFIASHGLSVRETSRADAFCQHVIGGRQPQTLMVPDALADPRFARNELVTGEPAVRFYVGAPLVTAGGEVLGALCAMDRVRC